MTLAERARSKNASYVLNKHTIDCLLIDLGGGPLQMYSTVIVSVYGL